MTLTIIIPVLDEADGIAAALLALAPLRQRGAEIIVVDGGSSDATPVLAAPHADQVIAAPRGRAVQMNAGAAIARGDVLVFLHADTRLPPDADRAIATGLAESGRPWGRFDVRIAGRHALFPVIARGMNLRSRLSGIATGDQAIFVKRIVFEAVGGFPAIPLMEDVALSVRLKRIGAQPVCLSARAVTSGRRWERHGVARTVLLMWRLRLAYWRGVAPDRLARIYGYPAPPQAARTDAAQSVAVPMNSDKQQQT